MIPILYAAKETDFTHGGIGALSETISCFVSEERNGAYEAEFTYPIDGILYSFITEDSIIAAKPNDTSKPQLFRIFKSSKPFDGKVTYNAEHISYCLNGNPIEEVDIKTANAQDALCQVLSAGILPHNFTAQSDIAKYNSTNIPFSSIRAALGGIKNSVLDVWGGEYEFDNFNVKLHSHRGAETGIKIAYGKNLTDLKQEKNIANVYTAVFPYAKYTPEKEEGSDEQPQEITVKLSEKIIYSQYAENYAYVRVLMKDFTEMFTDEEEITETKLRSKAESWVKTSGFDVPSVNINVSFKNLWQSPEYAKYSLLERVSLCDTVTVIYEKLGVVATAKVIKTKYNALKEKYENIELGNAKSNFADTINQATTSINNVKHEIKKQNSSTIEKLSDAIKKATNAITGQSGGYVVLNPASHPQEILIMDTNDINTAINVWRWNSGGLGHSSNGYNGPYELALTYDGSFVADLIRVGILDGTLLRANSVQANAISQSYTDSIINDVTKTIETIASKFEVTAEGLTSQISSLNKTVSDNKEKTEEQINKLQNSIDGLSYSVQRAYRGGINNIVNSSGMNGVSDDWKVTGSVHAIEDSTTTAGCCFRLSQNSVLSQTVNNLIAGTSYTFSVRVKKPYLGYTGCIKLTHGETVEIVFNQTTPQSSWDEYFISIPSLTASYAIIEISSAKDYMFVADMILCEGLSNAPIGWQPSHNEIYTTEVKIDKNGLRVIKSDSSVSTSISNSAFKVQRKTNKGTYEDSVLITEDDAMVNNMSLNGFTQFIGASNTIARPCLGGIDFTVLD